MADDRSTAPRHFRLSGRREREQDLFFEQALDPALWQAGDDNNWDTCWHTGMPERAAFRRTGPDCTVNHIPGNNGLTIKSRLYATIRSLQERVHAGSADDDPVRRRVDFMPAVYSMPDDYHALQRDAQHAPDKRWMLKPKNSARGKDIRLLDDAAQAPTDAKWMVQQYIDDPHLMNGRKYVLRLYVLIAGIEPLRVYLYEQGFAKLASCPYTLDDIDNPYVHLTNPDVNARNEEADSPVVFVDFERYRRWLREQGHDDEALFRRIRDLVALTMMGAREHMRTSTMIFGADARGCYELIGLDCLIDANLDPWLLECNLSPSMGVCARPDDGGDIEGRVKGQLVADMVSLLGLNQPTRVQGERASPAAAIRAVATAELERAGGFERVFPAVDIEDQLRFLPFPRLADIVLADAVAGRPVERPHAVRWRAAEIIADDELTLYGEARGEVYATNPAAALIWLRATEGVDADTIAEELMASAGVDPAADPKAAWEVRRQAWDALADWANADLLVQQTTAMASASVDPVSSLDPAAWMPRQDGAAWSDLQVGAHPIRIRTWSAPLASRLQPLFRPMEVEMADGGIMQLDLARGRSGFTVLADGEIVAENLMLAEVGPWLSTDLLRRAPAAGEVALTGTLVTREDSIAADAGAVLLCRAAADCDDATAVMLGCGAGQRFHGGTRIDLSRTGRAVGVGLPVRVRAEALDAVGRAVTARSANDACPSPASWWFGRRGHLVPSHAPERSTWYPVPAVVIVRRADDDRSGDTLERLSVRSALGYLLPAISGTHGDRADRATILHLAEWLGGRELYAVDDTDPGKASRIVTRHLQSEPDRVVAS